MMKRSPRWVVLATALLVGCSTTRIEPSKSVHIEPLPEDLVNLDERLYKLQDREFFGKPSNEWAASLQAYHLYLLERCRLPSLWRAKANAHRQEYRLIAWIGGHEPKSPFALRVFWSRSQPYISKYWFPDYKQRFLASAVQMVTCALAREDAEDILSGLSSMGFWEIASIDGDVPCHLHEGRRFLEGLRMGNYHCVDVGEVHYEEHRAYLDFCRRLQDLIPSEEQ